MTLHDRVRLMLRDRQPAVLTDRQAVAQLRPYGQGVQAAPVNPPLTNNTPELATAEGVLGEPVFELVPKFTSQ